MGTCTDPRHDTPCDDQCDACKEECVPTTSRKIFRTNDWKDSKGIDLQARNNTGCEVLRPLTAEEADLDEVGPMFRIRFADGVETDAFADELNDIAPDQEVQP